VYASLTEEFPDCNSADIRKRRPDHLDIDTTVQNGVPMIGFFYFSIESNETVNIFVKVASDHKNLIDPKKHEKIIA